MERKNLLFTSLSSALATLYGPEIKLNRTLRLTGGDINKSYGLELSNGVDVFMKANAKENVSFFLTEVNNLWAIQQTNSLRTPNVFAYGTDNGEEVGYSFLLMEYIPEVRPEGKFWESLALGLAELHKADIKKIFPEEKFGFFEDNFIGRTKQINSPKEKWIDFFRENRLFPQFKLAEKYFSKDDVNKFDKILNNLEKILIEPQKASLLHGDLWAGNILCSKETGEPVLIDPASYCGHPEADIAMTELFGAFPVSFYDCYKENGLMEVAYEERRDLYNLYHILNHLNLFGENYLSASLEVIDKYSKIV